MSESKDKTQNGATKAKIKVNNHPEFPATDSGTVMSTIDMDKMFKMIQEHSTDLQEMAAAYISAEQANAEVAQSLSSDVIV